jgi:hypothetical protein
MVLSKISNSDIVALAIARAIQKKSGEEFCVPSLFSKDEWQSIPSDQKAVIGRMFSQDSRTKIMDTGCDDFKNPHHDTDFVRRYQGKLNNN